LPEQFLLVAGAHVAKGYGKDRHPVGPDKGEHPEPLVVAPEGMVPVPGAQLHFLGPVAIVAAVIGHQEERLLFSLAIVAADRQQILVYDLFRQEGQEPVPVHFHGLEEPMAGILLHHVPMLAGFLVPVHGCSAEQQGAQVVEDLQDFYALLLVRPTKAKNASDCKSPGKILDLACNGVGVIGKIHQHVRHKLLVLYRFIVHPLYQICELMSIYYM